MPHCDDHLSKDLRSCAITAALSLASAAGALAWLYFHRKGPTQRAAGENKYKYFGSILPPAPSGMRASRKT